MGAKHSKARASDLSIHMYVKSGDGYDSMLTIRRCMSRLGMITVFDRYGDKNKEIVMFEFKKDVNENDVWEYVSESVVRHLKEHGVLRVSNNFRNAYAVNEYSEKMFDDMREHTKALVRFMLKASSLYLDAE